MVVTKNPSPQLSHREGGKMQSLSFYIHDKHPVFFFFAKFIQLLAEIYLIFAAEPKGVAAPQITSSGDEGVEIIPLDRVLHLQVSILLSERGRS
jgi:hypothetical protein